MQNQKRTARDSISKNVFKFYLENKTGQTRKHFAFEIAVPEKQNSTKLRNSGIAYFSKDRK